MLILWEVNLVELKMKNKEFYTKLKPQSTIESNN